MEPEELADVPAGKATIRRAEGVLAALLNVPVLDAAVSLDLKAQFSGMSLEDTAQRVLDHHEQRVDVAAPGALDERTLAILRQHLDSGAGPLDLPTPSGTTG